LRDLVDFERLTAAEPHHNKAKRRNAFSHCCPPGVCRAVGSAEIGASKVV
jgi:hypothetical protein